MMKPKHLIWPSLLLIMTLGLANTIQAQTTIVADGGSCTLDRNMSALDDASDDIRDIPVGSAEPITVPLSLPKGTVLKRFPPVTVTVRCFPNNRQGNSQIKQRVNFYSLTTANLVPTTKHILVKVLVNGKDPCNDFDTPPDDRLYPTPYCVIVTTGILTDNPKVGYNIPYIPICNTIEADANRLRLGAASGGGYYPPCTIPAGSGTDGKPWIAFPITLQALLVKGMEAGAGATTPVNQFNNTSAGAIRPVTTGISVILRLTTGVGTLRQCPSTVTLSKNLIDFQKIPLVKNAKGQMIAQEPFSVSMTRTCGTESYGLKGLFTAKGDTVLANIPGQGQNKVGLTGSTGASAGVGVQITENDVVVPLGSEFILQQTTKATSGVKNYSAKLFWMSDDPPAGAFSLTTGLEVFYY